MTSTGPEPDWRIVPLDAEVDLDELGRVHVQVWREAYAGHMPDDYLAGLSVEERARLWRSAASDADTAARTLVAHDADGQIVGFISSGPSRDEDAPTEWELYAVNLLERVHGSGLADELMTRALGDRPATLWVLEDNARAQAFYRRHGFEPEGARTAHEATQAPEIRMIRR